MLCLCLSVVEHHLDVFTRAFLNRFQQDQIFNASVHIRTLQNVKSHRILHAKQIRKNILVR